MPDSNVGLRLSLKGQSQTRSGLDDTASRIRRIGETAKSASKNSESLFGSLVKFGALSSVANSVTHSIQRLTTGVVSVGVKTASSTQQAQIGFTTLLGSAQKAQAFIAEMQTFARNTPFEYQDVQLGSQRLLAMGVAAKDVIPYLTAIGDAASGLGGGADLINQIVTAVGQMSAKGKIQSDEILQLTEAGIPALRILAAQAGVTTTQMQQMITAGQVTSDKALPALIAGLEKGTKSTAAFGGMMAKQSKTLAGEWSNLTDTVTQGLGKLFTPLVPQMTRTVRGAIAASTPLFSYLDEHADGFGRRLEARMATLQTRWGDFDSSFRKHGGMDSLRDVTGDIATSMGLITGDFTKSSHQSQTIGENMAVVAKKIHTILSDINKVVGWMEKTSPLDAVKGLANPHDLFYYNTIDKYVKKQKAKQAATETKPTSIGQTTWSTKRVSKADAGDLVTSKAAVANSGRLTTLDDLTKKASARAAGGPVSIGNLYRVEERKQEFLQSAVNGRVLTTPIGQPAGGGGAQRIDNHVHVHLDGKEITNSVITEVRSKDNRR